MSVIPVSICVIARNEEEHIEECLKRLKPYDFEIIVTDTGSADQTRQIAGNYADKVLDFPWSDDFSAARNFCAENASNRYILALDCDEYMDKCEVGSLKTLMKTGNTFVGALQIKSIIIQSDGRISHLKDSVPRFYDKALFKYSGVVHEQIVSRKSGLAPQQSILLPMEVIHHGYALPPGEMRIKQERNLHLLHRALAQEGESAYLCFQIGQSELVLENCERAIEFYEKGLRLVTEFHPLYVHSMVEGLAKAYMMSGRARDALALMERYEPYCESARFVFYHANVLMDNSEPLRALMKYVKATIMPDTGMLGEELLYCYKHIIELYHLFGEDALAGVFYEKYEECRKSLTVVFDEN